MIVAAKVPSIETINSAVRAAKRAAYGLPAPSSFETLMLCEIERNF